MDLELAEHMFGARNREVAGLFDIELRHDTVVDNHRIALPAFAQPEAGTVHGQSDRFGEIAIAVGQHGDVVRTGSIVPCAHDEGIVDRCRNDFIDALRLQLVGLFDIARQMARRASWRECSGDREEGDFLALEILSRIDLFRAVLGRFDQGYIGQFVAHRNRHVGNSVCPILGAR